MKTTHNTQMWQLARKTFETLIDVPISEAEKKLLEMKQISPEVKQRVRRLLLALEKSKTILNEADSGQIYQRISTLSDMTGQQISHYKLTELIAVGGMSSVYKAQRIDSKVQKPVAIKVMSSYIKSTDVITLFNQEQQALSRLNHPNIVSFQHGGQTQNDIYYLAMEFIEEGITLDEYIELNRCNTKQIVSLIKQVAEAMVHAHDNLVIHSDLKTSNLLIDQNDNVKIIDFGIAALTKTNESQSTTAYTPDIASPEQIKGEHITIKTDIFSLAATLLQLLIKDKPLPEFKPDTYRESDDQKYITEKLASSSLDRDLCNILNKALSTNTKQRYSTMHDFAQDLNRWLEHRPVLATRATASYRLKKTIRRNPLFSILSLAFFIVLISALLMVQNHALSAKKEASNAQLTMEFLTKVLSQTDPSQGNSTHITVQEALKTTLNQQKEILAKTPELQVSILSKVLTIYNTHGLYNEGAEISDLIHQTLVKLDGRSSSKAINQQLSTAAQYQASSQFNKAIKEAKEVIRMLDKHDKEGIPLPISRLNALNIIIKSYAQLSKNVETNQYRDKAIELIDSNNFDDKPIFVGRIYNTFAVLASRQKQYQLSEEYYQKSLHYFNESAKKPLWLYAGILNGYASILRKQKQYRKAELIYIESIEIARSFDPQSHILARNLNQYSGLLSQTNRYDEALENLNEALAILSQKENKYTMLLVQENRHQFYSRNNQLSVALDAVLYKLQLAKDMFGLSNKRTARHLNELASILSVLNQPKPAIKALEQVISYYNEVDDTIALAKTYAESGLIHLQNQDLIAATDMHKKAQQNDPNHDGLEIQILAQLLDQFPESKQTTAIPIDPNEQTISNRTLAVLFAHQADSNINKSCNFDRTILDTINLLLKQVFLQECSKLGLEQKLSHTIKSQLNSMELATEKINSSDTEQSLIKMFKLLEKES